MARYAVPFAKTGINSVTELVEILSSATAQRQRIDFFSVGCVATPADAFFTYVVRRVTNSATGTAVTPTPIDPNDAPARCVAEDHITTDATTFITPVVEVFRTPCHHRATYTFAAADGQELVGAAIPSNGIALGVTVVSSLQFEGVIHYKE